MTMQRRHFELIASTLRDALSDTGFHVDQPVTGEQRGVENTIYRFASQLAATNPNFNRARFLTACGVEG